MENGLIKEYSKDALIRSIKSHYARISPYDYDDYTVEFEIKNNELVGGKLVLINKDQ